MKHATLAIALIAAVTTLPGCLTLGDTNEVYPPTVGRELTDLRMSAERGALSQQEYDYKKAQILAGHKNGQNRGGGAAAAPADPFGEPNAGMAQAPQDPQWQQGYGQPPEGFAPQPGQVQVGQMPMSPQEMQQPPQYAPQQMQEMFQQQQMQQPQAQQMSAEGWH